MKSLVQKLRHIPLRSQAAGARFLSKHLGPVVINPDHNHPYAEAVTEWDTNGHIIPHGGKIVNRFVSSDDKDAVLRKANAVLDVSERQSCDVELICNGGFSPLEGFMNPDLYNSVVEKMRLPGSELLFGLPVVLDVPNNRDDIKPGQNLALTHHGQVIAVMEVDSRWTPNKVKETRYNYGTASLEHPGTSFVALERGRDYIGGVLHGISVPSRSFKCLSPAELRATFPSKTDVVVFQCRNPIHRAHYELFTRALDAPNVQSKGLVLVHPTMGPTQSDDISAVARWRTYEVLKDEVKNPRVRWSYLPYSMHMAGPREAIQHMVIRKNFGCTHFIIGRDMAGSKSSLDGKDWYGSYDAQTFARQHSAELGVKTVASLDLVYTKSQGYVTAEQAKKDKLEVSKLSGTEFRRRLRAGEEIPEWFAFKSVVQVLREYPA